MKLFQRLLLAPAALGLMAPMAANADVSGISKDSAPNIEVIQLQVDELKSQLSQLQVALDQATPEGSLNQEVIQARVDGVEAQLGEIMAGQFSSSTKMSGKAAFITGYVDDDAESDTDSITMEYMYQLNMITSFTGEDMLYARLKAGNVSDHFVDKGQGTYLSAGKNTSDSLTVDKIWYQFPVGDDVTVWVGPKIENYYMLASSPSIYKPVTKQFSLGGNGTVYGSSTKAGFGAAYVQPTEDPSAGRFAVSVAYTNQSGAKSGKDQGLFGEDGKSALLTKLEYGTPQWQVSGAVALKENGWEDSYFTTALGKDRSAAGSETAVGLRAYWRPDTTGAIPEVQLAYDVSTIDDAPIGFADEASGWMVGLGWKDLLIDGNRAGVAFGSRVSATSIVGGTSDPSEDNSVWEAYYSFKINDGVTVTPAFFGGSDVESEGKDVSGAVVLTEFRF